MLLKLPAERVWVVTFPLPRIRLAKISRQEENNSNDEAANKKIDLMVDDLVAKSTKSVLFRNDLTQILKAGYRKNSNLEKNIWRGETGSNNVA